MISSGSYNFTKLEQRISVTAKMPPAAVGPRAKTVSWHEVKALSLLVLNVFPSWIRSSGN